MDLYTFKFKYRWLDYEKKSCYPKGVWNEKFEVEYFDINKNKKEKKKITFGDAKSKEEFWDNPNYKNIKFLQKIISKEEADRIRCELDYLCEDYGRYSSLQKDVIELLHNAEAGKKISQKRDKIAFLYEGKSFWEVSAPLKNWKIYYNIFSESDLYRRPKNWGQLKDEDKLKSLFCVSSIKDIQDLLKELKKRKYKISFEITRLSNLNYSICNLPREKTDKQKIIDEISILINHGSGNYDSAEEIFEKIIKPMVNTVIDI